MFKTIYLLTFLLIVSVFSSCTNTDDYSDSNVEITLETEELFIGRTIAKINMHYFIKGNINIDKRTILYRPINSSEEYKLIEYNQADYDIITTFIDLIPGTTYEYLFEVIDGNRKVQSKSFYFTTNIIAFDYEDFFKDFKWSTGNYYGISSFNGKTHAIKAYGLGNLKDEDIQVFFVTEQKRDSVQVKSKIDGEYLTFTTPEGFVKDTPREHDRLAYIGIKVKNDYAYLLNKGHYITNIADNQEFKKEIFGIKYIPHDNVAMYIKVFNPKPYIDDVRVFFENYPACPKYVKIVMDGDFLMSNKEKYNEGMDYPNLPKKFQVLIFEENGNLYTSRESLYEYQPSKGCTELSAFQLYRPNRYNSLKEYHLYNQIVLKDLIPKGNYAIKVSFIMQNGEVLQTNTKNFTIPK